MATVLSPKIGSMVSPQLGELELVVIIKTIPVFRWRCQREVVVMCGRTRGEEGV